MWQVGDARIMYGKFLQTCVDFFIITAAIFVMVKIINDLRRKYEHKPPAATPPRQEQLLEEIRDLLKRRSASELGMVSFSGRRRPTTERRAGSMCLRSAALTCAGVSAAIFASKSMSQAKVRLMYR